MTPSPATPEERPSALAVAFGREPAAVRLARVSAALSLFDDGVLDPDGLLVVRTATGRVAGAMLVQPLPGRGALVWPPAGVDGETLAVAAVNWLRSVGCRFAQALVEPEELPYCGPLQAAGFAHITRLWALRRAVEIPTVVRAPSESGGVSPPLAWEEHGNDPDAFARVLIESAAGSLDCPELDGVRTADDVLAAHRAAGYAPGRWWLVRLGGVPVGVLLLGDGPTPGDREVSYLGVLTLARRRGVGRALLRRAYDLAVADGSSAVTISVDQRNEPARWLYREEGFHPFEVKEVLLAVWS